jgi:hypothetical protein
MVALPTRHIERPHAVGAHVAEGHRVAGWGAGSCAHAGEDTMAAFEQSCRRSGHVLMSLTDPKRPKPPSSTAHARRLQQIVIIGSKHAAKLPKLMSAFR